MNQHSPLTPTPDGDQTRPWLHALYQARRQRTVTLVKATVDRLVGEGRTVTIEAICQVSRKVDSEGKGIKKAGVLGNAEAYAYYRQHSATYQRAHQRLRHAPRQEPMTSTTLPHIDLERDITRVRQSYTKLSKAELVERLLSVEHAYGQLERQLTHLQFEFVELQQPPEDGQKTGKAQHIGSQQGYR